MDYFTQNTQNEPYSGVKLAKHNDWHRREPVIPSIDQRTHDRTRWKRNKIKSKLKSQRKHKKFFHGLDEFI